MYVTSIIHIIYHIVFTHSKSLITYYVILYVILSARKPVGLSRTTLKLRIKLLHNYSITKWTTELNFLSNINAWFNIAYSCKRFFFEKKKHASFIQKNFTKDFLKFLIFQQKRPFALHDTLILYSKSHTRQANSYNHKQTLGKALPKSQSWVSQNIRFNSALV